MLARLRNVEFNEDSAVMYDPLNQTLFQGSIKALGNEHHIDVPIKKGKTKVDIRVPISRRTSSISNSSEKKQIDNEFGVYLATVNLSSLGRTVKKGVKSGKIKHICVLGYVPDQLIYDSSDENLNDE